MGNNDFIVTAYDYANSLLDNGIDPKITIKTNIDIESDHITKAINPISRVSRFWSNTSDKEIPIFFVSVDENGKEYLREQLGNLGFLDAMPEEDKWNSNIDTTIFGSGGHSFLHNQAILVYWQVAGSKNRFDDTGTLKTAPHLFTHAIQSIAFEGTSQILTDLPGWFIEGQADFIGLFSISNSLSEYLYHRRNFFSVAYVPGGPEVKLTLKQYTERDWYDSLYNSPQKFAGIKLVDEYYSGLMAYEFLLSEVGSDNILEIYNRFLNGEDFYALVEDYSGYSKHDFCIEVSKKLVDVSRGINA